MVRKVRDCRHKNQATCHCDGSKPITRCPSNTNKQCKVIVYSGKDSGYNPSWEQIKKMLGEA